MLTSDHPSFLETREERYTYLWSNPCPSHSPCDKCTNKDCTTYSNSRVWELNWWQTALHHLWFTPLSFLHKSICLRGNSSSEMLGNSGRGTAGARLSKVVWSRFVAISVSPERGLFGEAHACDSLLLLRWFQIDKYKQRHNGNWKERKHWNLLNGHRMYGLLARE